MIVLVQPPFVQLNTPYPSIYYLRSFLEKQGHSCMVQDHSIALFERIFCTEGLTRIFSDAVVKIKTREADGIDEQFLPVLGQFMAQRQLWIQCIDRLVSFLRGRDREFGHLIALANGVLPSGPRTQSLLEQLDYDPAPDDASRIASAMLADIAGFISATLDDGFSLVRYADSLAAGIHRFSALEAVLDGYILTHFYEPLLDECWTELESGIASHDGTAFILGLSVPFPGTLAAALFCARSAKRRFGSSRVPVLAGGGYVNTELRRMTAKTFFTYVDFLCYDRGYGAFDAVLRYLADREAVGKAAESGPLYRSRFYNANSGRIIGSADGPQTSPCFLLDKNAPLSVFPDYSGVDFSRYIQPVDDANPMHRLWSDGRWLKAYLAHGCYWHACAFCDVQLDYIRGFVPVDTRALFDHLCRQAEQSGVRAVHLVDEAAPLASLLHLALLNRAAGLPLVFWGNIRFERSFSPDAAAFLAAGGLLGISAGIEVASEQGFKRIGKGIGLADVVASCAAFKEAGILTHAYLIYGYWDEQPGEIVDSAEILRQLFELSLLDSAFWHKFVLTRHSRIYREYLRGRHQDLMPLEEVDIPEADFFADNDLRFAGEEESEQFGPVLDALLVSWMAGFTDNPVHKAFPFKVPETTIESGHCERFLNEYIRCRDARHNADCPDAEKGRYVFLGSLNPLETEVSVQQKASCARVSWVWRYEEHELILSDTDKAEALTRLLEQAAGAQGCRAPDFTAALHAIISRKEAAILWPKLRSAGLVRIDL